MSKLSQTCSRIPSYFVFVLPSRLPLGKICHQRQVADSIRFDPILISGNKTEKSLRTHNKRLIVFKNLNINNRQSLIWLLFVDIKKVLASKELNDFHKEGVRHSFSPPSLSSPHPFLLSLSHVSRSLPSKLRFSHYSPSLLLSQLPFLLLTLPHPPTFAFFLFSPFPTSLPPVTNFRPPPPLPSPPISDNLFLSFDLMLVSNILLVKKSATVHHHHHHHFIKI